MKNKLKLFLIVILITFASFSFVGCDWFNIKSQSTSIQLSTPNTPVIEKVDDKIIVSVNQITNATAYQISINGIIFTSESNSYDCTHALLNVGEYKFKVVALGTGDYTNSKMSKEASYVITKQLQAPVLTLSNNTLSWPSIQNALDYEVYCNNNLILTTQETSLDLTHETVADNFENVGSYNLKILAKQNGYYLQSAFSNAVTYVTTSQLSAPINLKVTKSSSIYILSWNAVDNATSYIVKCDGEIIEENITSTSLNVTTYITHAKDYNFSVKAITTNQYYANSDFSTSYTYANFIKLGTPSISSKLYINRVELSWNKIANANTYSLYINNQLYPKTIWSTQEEVVCVSLTKEYLSAYEKPLSFKVMSNGYENYLNSDYSSTQTISTYGRLNTPKNLAVVKNGYYSTLTFDAVEYAELYTISINNTHIKQTDKTSVDISDVVNTVSSYTIKVKCNETLYFAESLYSDTFYYNYKLPLTAPEIESATLSENKVTVCWNEIENATSYNVVCVDYANNTESTYNSTINSYTVSLQKAGRYGFYVIALGGDNYIDSNPSTVVNIEYKAKLQKPIINIQESVDTLSITWSKVNNAVEYEVVIEFNSQEETQTTTNTFYHLNIADLQEGTYTFKVTAIADINSYYLNSIQAETSYTYTISSGDDEEPDVGDENIGETYFYRGEEKDYNITSQEELNHALSYAILYQITEFKVNVKHFDYKTDLADKYYYYDFVSTRLKDISKYKQSDTTITNEVITALYSYNRDMGGWSGMNFNVEDDILTVNLRFASSPNPSVTSSQEYHKKDSQYAPFTVTQKGFTKRSDSFNNFAIDQLTEKVVVSTSNQLVEQISYLNRKPVFETTNSQAEQVYNKARSVLREIIADGMTEFEKVVAIYDWIVYNTTYDYAAANNDDNLENFNDYYAYYAEGVLLNEQSIAVCNGIAKAFTLMCAIEGINSKHVVGSIAGAGHAWNKVEIDGNWYVIDATNGGIDDFVAHCRYFMVSDSYIADAGFVEESIEIPQATSSYDYYSNISVYDCDLYITTESELAELIQILVIDNGITAIEVKCTLSTSQLLSAIIKSGIDYSQYQYFQSNGCYFIHKTS